LSPSAKSACWLFGCRIRDGAIAILATGRHVRQWQEDEVARQKAVLREDQRLAVSRIAARLFIERGVSRTSGDDIADAAGLSKRTIWRYFRTKESCVEPLFAVSSLKFASALRRWPAEVSIEAHFHATLKLDSYDPQDLADAALAIHLIALLPEEPALRSAWLMSCHVAEVEMINVIAKRLGRSADEFEVRLCAATVTAAIRAIDEDISVSAVKHAQKITSDEATDRLAAAVRIASTLPFCDPVA
jgi:AcrR family transcriptional regulator